jgi:hypothetical protein
LWSLGIFFPIWYVWTKKNLAKLTPMSPILMDELKLLQLETELLVAAKVYGTNVKTKKCSSEENRL